MDYNTGTPYTDSSGFSDECQCVEEREAESTTGGGFFTRPIFGIFDFFPQPLQPDPPVEPEGLSSAGQAAARNAGLRYLAKQKAKYDSAQYWAQAANLESGRSDGLNVAGRIAVVVIKENGKFHDVIVKA